MKQDSIQTGLFNEEKNMADSGRIEKNRRFISQLLPRKRTGNAGVSHRREQDERIAGIFEKQAQCGRLFHSRRNAE